MKQSDRVIVQKMISYCDDINQLMSRFHYNYEVYCNDISFQYACNMCIIQIGELVSRASDELMDNNPQIPWRAIKGMRNLHAHDYENVDLEIVWETLKTDIPSLKDSLTQLL